MKHRTQFIRYSFWNKHKSVERCSGKAFYDMKGGTDAHVAFCFLPGMQTCGGHLVMKGWPAEDCGRGVIHTVLVLLVTALSVFPSYELPGLHILSLLHAGNKTRPFCVLTKLSTTELHPQLLGTFVVVVCYFEAQSCYVAWNS